MNGQQLAGWQWAGAECSNCDQVIAETDVVDVREDGEVIGDGWRDLSRVSHVECPEAEA